METIDRVTNALRDALPAYVQLDPPSTTRIVLALFGVTHAKRLAPMLDEVARNLQALRA